MLETCCSRRTECGSTFACKWHQSSKKSTLSQASANGYAHATQLSAFGVPSVRSQSSSAAAGRCACVGPCTPAIVVHLCMRKSSDPHAGVSAGRDLGTDSLPEDRGLRAGGRGEGRASCNRMQHLHFNACDKQQHASGLRRLGNAAPFSCFNTQAHASQIHDRSVMRGLGLFGGQRCCGARACLWHRHR